LTRICGGGGGGGDKKGKNENAAGAAFKKAKYYGVMLPDGTQCCFNFNRPHGCSGKQRDGTVCTRTHACLHCGDKSHKLSDCPSASG
jgi:hypothetical protein